MMAPVGMSCSHCRGRGLKWFLRPRSSSAGTQSRMLAKDDEKN
jgi:hypothetical protein